MQGYKNDNLTLKDREWICPECGKKHDRDYNASVNIREEGKRLLNKNKIGMSSPELTLADISKKWEKQEKKEILSIRNNI